MSLETLRGIDTWIDLGCGEAGATTDIYPLPPRIRRISVDAAEPVSPPDGFVRDEIPHFLETHPTGPNCLISLMDVIEHFPEGDALALLDRLEKTSATLVIFTPEGFYQQDATSHPEFAELPYQWHRSGWTGQAFHERGYAVVQFPQLHMGFGGFAAVRLGPCSRLEYLRWRLGLEAIRMRPFITPRTCFAAVKEHVRFRHGNSGWYSQLRNLNQRRG